MLAGQCLRKKLDPTVEQLWSQCTAESLPFRDPLLQEPWRKSGFLLVCSLKGAPAQNSFLWLRHRPKERNHAQTWRVKWGPAALPIRLVIPLCDPPPLYPSLHNLLPLNNSLNHRNHSNFRVQQAELSHITPPSGVSFCRRVGEMERGMCRQNKQGESQGNLRQEQRARSIQSVEKTWIWGNTSSSHRHENTSCVGPVRKGVKEVGRKERDGNWAN